MTRAVIVDIALLLDFADHRAATLRALDQAREGEVMLPALRFLRKAAVEHGMHPIPQFDGDQRLVPALDQSAIPLEPACIQAVAEDRVNGAHRHLSATLRIDET